MIHTKWFLLIIEFLASRHLEMWHSCIAVPDPHLFIAIVFIKSRDWHYNAHMSHFKMVAHRKSMIKTNCLTWNIYRELSNLSCWCRHKLRKTLIWDWYCWTAEVPFKKHPRMSNKLKHYIFNPLITTVCFCGLKHAVLSTPQAAKAADMIACKQTHEIKAFSKMGVLVFSNWLKGYSNNVFWPKDARCFRQSFWDFQGKKHWHMTVICISILPLTTWRLFTI